MKILILTPINPVHAADVYVKLAKHFNEEKRKLNLICYPFFAEMESMKSDKDYLPTFFSMLKAAVTKEMQKKLYNTDKTVVIGNTYKQDKFDIIISFNDIDEEVFDKYLETLWSDEEIRDMTNLLNMENLYTPEDAELNMPTIDHIILFLESTFFPNTNSEKVV